MRFGPAPACLAAALFAAAAAIAQEPAPQARVTLVPPVARLGERVLYRGQVVVSPATAVRWFAPDTAEALTWGAARVRRSSASGGSAGHPRSADTVSVEIPLQAFQPGRIDIAGMRLRMGEDSSSAVEYRLPMTSLTILPVMTAADSQATLREVHGPLAAPWWERMPWTWVVAGALLVAALILLIKRMRRRRPQAAPVPQPVQAIDPAVAALAALAELRALGLPEEGRFAEHSFRLGQILRRFLEARFPATRPGDTTPELVRHLAEGRLDEDEVRRLGDLLRGWDRVKFAREPWTAEQAHRGELAVEALVRRPAAEPPAKVA